MTTPTLELWSIAAAIVSVLLGFLAITLSVHFFGVGRRTEREVSNSLVKIEAQTEMLQKITGRQMDRLTRYATEDRPRREDPQLDKFIALFMQLAQPLTGNFAQPPTQAPGPELTAELVSCYIALYYYAAVANYWSQQFLPRAAEFDETSEFHKLAHKVVDQSVVDFEAMAVILAKVSPEVLDTSPLAHILREAQTTWRAYVRSSADVFIARERGE